VIAAQVMQFLVRHYEDIFFSWQCCRWPAAVSQLLHNIKLLLNVTLQHSQSQ